MSGSGSCKSMSDTEILNPGTLLLSSEPFAYVGRLGSPQTICDTCLTIGGRGHHRRCTSCQEVWYCSEACQWKGWRMGHKFECKRMGLLKLIPESHDLTVTWMTRILIRIILKLQDGIDHYEELDIGGTRVRRRFQDLMSNSKELRENREHMQIVEMILQFAKLLFGPTDNIRIPNDEELLEICGKVFTNAFKISNGSFEVGYGLYLASSICNHSCNHMAVHTFDGTRMNIRNIREISKSLPIDKVTISYSSALLPSWERRLKLKNNWYFHCECERCETGRFDKEMRSIICPNRFCQGEIDTKEMRNPCSVCGHVMKEETIAKVLNVENYVVLYLKAGKFDLQFLEACILMMKANNFSDTHWLMVDLYRKAYIASERISEMTRYARDKQRTYDYGSKYIMGVRRYLQPFDVERLRTLLDMAYLCIELRKIDEAKQHISEAKLIAQVVYGKESHYVRTHIDSLLPFLELLARGLVKCEREKILQDFIVYYLISVKQIDSGLTYESYSNCEMNTKPRLRRG